MDFYSYIVKVNGNDETPKQTVRQAKSKRAKQAIEDDLDETMEM